MKVLVEITINGRTYSGDVEPRQLLVHFIREEAGLTGTKVGCDTSQCGSCTVKLDGLAVKACTVLAVQASGSEVTSIEGLSDGVNLHPLQEAFWNKHGLQCGFLHPWDDNCGQRKCCAGTPRRLGRRYATASRGISAGARATRTSCSPLKRLHA